MTIDAELKREGIEVIKSVDTLTINSIAKTVSKKLINAFPEHNLNEQDLFINLSRLSMYVAKMPYGISKAKYFYRNQTIYFSEDLDNHSLITYAMHECIHYLQELRDDKGNLLYLGLCDFTSNHLNGMALNEAAVQLMSAKALEFKTDVVKYYDITLPTSSPFHYALECNLVTQMAYITGNYILFHNTLCSNNSFKDKFIALTSKRSFARIQKSLDKLLELEDTLSTESCLLEKIEETNPMITKIINHITLIRNNIKKQFLETQNLILTSYFDSYFNLIDSTEQMECYRKRLYNYKDLIGTTDNYTYFNDYYIHKMADLEYKRTMLENTLYSSDTELALIPMKHNLVLDMFRKLKRLFIGNREYEQIRESKNETNN